MKIIKVSHRIASKYTYLVVMWNDRRDLPNDDCKGQFGNSIAGPRSRVQTAIVDILLGEGEVPSRELSVAQLHVRCREHFLVEATPAWLPH